MVGMRLDIALEMSPFSCNIDGVYRAQPSQKKEERPERRAVRCIPAYRWRNDVRGQE